MDLLARVSASEVRDHIRAISESSAFDILDELESKAVEIPDPTAWIIEAAKKQLSASPLAQQAISLAGQGPHVSLSTCDGPARYTLIASLRCARAPEPARYTPGCIGEQWSCNQFGLRICGRLVAIVVCGRAEGSQAQSENAKRTALWAGSLWTEAGIPSWDAAIGTTSSWRMGHSSGLADREPDRWCGVILAWREAC